MRTEGLPRKKHDTFNVYVQGGSPTHRTLWLPRPLRSRKGMPSHLGSLLKRSDRPQTPNSFIGWTGSAPRRALLLLACRDRSPREHHLRKTKPSGPPKGRPSLALAIPCRRNGYLSPPHPQKQPPSPAEIAPPQQKSATVPLRTAPAAVACRTSWMTERL